MRRARWLALLVALAMSLAACGSKDNGGVITPSGDSTTSTSTTAP